MKMKILSLFVVGTLFFSTVNVIGSTSDDDGTIKIAQEKDHISFSQATVETKGKYISVNIEEANTFMRDTGKPLLPVYTKTFTFPKGTKIKNVECTISDISSEIIYGKIQPSPRPIPKISLKNSIQQNDGKEIINNQEKTIEDASVYSSSDLFPDGWFNYKIGCGLNNGQDTIFVKVDCFPIRYSPAENTLYYINTFDIKITYEEVLEKAPSSATYDLLIITPQKFKLFLLPLYFHKIKMGVPTKIVTVESIYKEYTGRDKPEQIKYCIKDAKEKWGITYVLLLGGLRSNINADDKDNTNEGSTDWYLPVRYTNTYYDWGEPSHISDLYYADLYKGQGEFEDWNSNGDGVFGDEDDNLDLYPDVYYGRLPCTTIFEVITIVKKIIRYEKPSILGKSWLNRMIAAGGMTTESWYEGQPDGEWLCDESIEYMGDIIKYPVRIFASNNESSGDPRPVPEDIIKQLNKGVGFVILEGHGNTWAWDTHWPNTDVNWTGGITNFDMPFLFNNKKLPIVVVGGCHNGLFNVSLLKAIKDDPTGYNSMYHTYGLPIRTCFSWKLCTKPGGGAIASTGCTAFGLGSAPPDSYSGGLESNFFYEIGQDNAKTLGAAHSGSITKYINDTYVENDDVYVITEYQLFGDPSLRIGGY
jgi:hypothetical protein